jgi:hypothetical protein
LAPSGPELGNDRRHISHGRASQGLQGGVQVSSVRDQEEEAFVSRKGDRFKKENIEDVTKEMKITVLRKFSWR